MAKKSSILLEADPDDPEDFSVDRAGAGPCPHGAKDQASAVTAQPSAGRALPSDTASR